MLLKLRTLLFLNSYIEDYKQKQSVQPTPKLQTNDISLPNGCVVKIIEGDLTKMKCDAVVSSSVGDLSHKRKLNKEEFTFYSLLCMTDKKK